MEYMSVLMRLSGGPALINRTQFMRRPGYIVGFIH